MIDEREAHEVRAWLATAEAPDLRLDLRHTVQTGRRKARHRRNRRIAGGGALVLAALLAVPGTVMLLSGGDTDAPPASARRTPPPDGPFSCSYQALPVPTGLDALGRDWQPLYPDLMDPSGRYVATQAMLGGDAPDQVRVPVLWDNGVGRVISPELRGRPTAVFENGVVVGERMPGVGTWIYRDGKVSDLPLPAGAAHMAIATVEANGDILGSVYTTSPNTARVALWKGGDLAKPRYLDAPGDIVTPVAALDDGSVVGWQSIERLPYVWAADGRGKQYSEPAGALDYRAVGVSDGYLYGIGKRAVAEEGMVPIRWKIGGDGTAEWFQAPAGLPAGTNVELAAVGRNGGMLFQVLTGAGDPLRFFVVRGAYTTELPAPDGRYAYADAMDEFGTKVAGVVVGPGTSSTPVLWTC